MLVKGGLDSADIMASLHVHTVVDIHGGSKSQHYFDICHWITQAYLYQEY